VVVAALLGLAVCTHSSLAWAVYPTLHLTLSRKS
jgi:hypothetical protein